MELLARFKNKINWKNYSDWNIGLGFEVAEDDDGIYTLYKIPTAQSYVSKNLLELNKKYRISFELKSDANNHFSGGITFIINNNSTFSESTIGKHEFVTNNIINTTLKFKPFAFNNTWSLYNLVIEEINYTALDLIEYEDIVLRFQVSDIRDYSSRKGLISQTFTLPGTKNNNKFFKNIKIINQDNRYNIYNNVSALVSLGSGNYYGSLILNNIVEYEGYVEYEVYFTGDNLNLFTEIGEDELQILTPIMTELNHLPLKGNVCGSWEDDVPYKYGYIDYGSNKNGGGLTGYVGSATDLLPSVGLTVTDLYPSVKVKYIWDKIFEYYGYTYTSELINEDWFSKIFLPYTNKKENLYNWCLNSRVVYNNRSYNHLDSYQLQSSVYFTTGVQYNCTLDGIPGYKKYANTIGNDLYLTSDRELYRLFNYTPTTSSNIQQSSNSMSLQGKASELNPNGYQTNRQLAGSYLCKRGGVYKIKMSYNISNVNQDGDLINIYAGKINKSSVNFSNSSVVEYSVNSNGVEELNLVDFTAIPTVGVVEYTFNNCVEGDMLYFKFRRADAYSFNYTVKYIEIWEYAWGESSDFLKADKIIPENFKIKDFLSSIIQMFNLYVDVDKDNPNNLIIETRDKYYSNGDTYEWTTVDMSKIEIDTPKDYQNKINILKYTDDSDYHNELYADLKDVQKVRYGGKKFIIDNDSTEGSDEMVISFSPTILRDDWRNIGYTGKFQFVLSTMWDAEYPTTSYIQINEKLDYNFRILFFNYIDIFDNGYSTLNKTNFNVAGYRNTKYPYMGHILNPFDLNNSTNLDLNFDTRIYSKNLWQKMFTGNPGTSITKNNLYNLYYLNQLSEFIDKDSRVIRVNVYLSDSDIIKLKMNDRILIDETFYHINYLEYNLVNPSLSKVELIKILDNPDIDFYTYIEVEDDIPIKPKPPIDGTFGISLGNNLIRNKKNFISIGDNNIVGNDTIILGSNNKVSDNNTILGSDNVNVESFKNVVINSDNINLKSSITKAVLINTTNKNIDSNSVSIGNLYFYNGNIIENGGIADEGLDIVYNPFMKNCAMFIDCGENIYRISDNNLNVIEDGGLD